MRTIRRPATRQCSSHFLEPERPNRPVWRASRVAAWFLLLLPVAGISQVAAPDDGLQREWLEVQVDGDQRSRREWWQHLSPGQLDALIRASVEVNVSDARGWTPLHSAARFNNDPDVLLGLLNAGAVIDAKDRSGDTPLHWAAAENANVGITIALLEAGADVNATDSFGWLPIHTAADSNPNPEVIDALLKAGADRSARAYFVLFSPAFLLKHNSNMSDTDKKIASELLQESEPTAATPP